MKYLVDFEWPIEKLTYSFNMEINQLSELFVVSMALQLIQQEKMESRLTIRQIQIEKESRTPNDYDYYILKYSKHKDCKIRKTYIFKLYFNHPIPSEEVENFINYYDFIINFYEFTNQNIVQDREIEVIPETYLTHPNAIIRHYFASKINHELT